MTPKDKKSTISELSDILARLEEIGDELESFEENEDIQYNISMSGSGLVDARTYLREAIKQLQ